MKDFPKKTNAAQTEGLRGIFALIGRQFNVCPALSARPYDLTVEIDTVIGGQLDPGFLPTALARQRAVKNQHHTWGPGFFIGWKVMR
ncbi:MULTISPECIES: hypothetical protein [unclassified Pseudomonas]|uniref:hypothetical protein n=1 Tax=unclassified Pseudomonas TaxID=196821 RepID=UPI0030DC3A47